MCAPLLVLGKLIGGTLRKSPSMKKWNGSLNIISNLVYLILVILIVHNVISFFFYPLNIYAVLIM